MDTLERNRKNVIDFYDLMFNQARPAEAVERFVGSEYIQHNPLVADGKLALIAWFEELDSKYPGKQAHFVRAIAEGDLVALHCRLQWPSGRETAGIDMFRLDDAGKVIEHWGVLQSVPKEAANNNSMF